MKNHLFTASLLLLLSLTFSNAQNNENNNSEQNRSKVQRTPDKNTKTKTKKLQQQINEQMKREKKYEKEKIFYQGSDYNLSEHEVDPDSLDSINVIEPDYDFVMDDVY